jgi:hypothetical protein
MTTIQKVLGAMMIGASTNAQSAPPIVDATIVLVHGALIDGSSWRGVYDVLTTDGYRGDGSTPAASNFRAAWCRALTRAVATSGSNWLCSTKMSLG